MFGVTGETRKHLYRCDEFQVKGGLTLWIAKK